jgi:hypothetical protein
MYIYLINTPYTDYILISLRTNIYEEKLSHGKMKSNEMFVYTQFYRPVWILQDFLSVHNVEILLQYYQLCSLLQ